MLLSRILGGVGRFCIGLGVLTLLFVAYQLWGTGILTAQAQDGLENDFKALLERAVDIDDDAIELAAEIDSDPEPESESTDGTGEGSDPETDPPEEEIDPAVAERAARELEILSTLIWQDNGEPVARLVIPDLDLSWTVVEGVGTDELRDGPGHYPGTPMPGMAGNASLAGHRTTWGAPFNRIDELEPGDEITVSTIQGTFEYRVVAQENGKGHFIVSPERVDVLDQDFTVHPNRLTLTACHPKFSARQRIIVVAELIGEPAITVPFPEEFELTDNSLASEDLIGEDSGAASSDGGELPGDPDLDDGADGSDPDGGDLESTDGGSAAEDDTDTTATDPDTSADGEDQGGQDDDGEPAVATGDGGGPPQTRSIGFQGTSETDDFGEGLNGDRSAIFPAVMWGLAAAAIIGTTGFVARRWRKWPSYAVALTPFALVLFVCFVHIDQALPSY